MKKLLLPISVAALAAIPCVGVTIPEGHFQPHSKAHRSFSSAKRVVLTSQPAIDHVDSKSSSNQSGAVVSVAPEGEKITMLGSAMSFFVDYGEVTDDESYGIAYEAIVTPENEIYLKNPISTLTWDTYIKGKWEGDSFHFTLPQPIYSLESGEEIYADVLEYKEVPSEEDPDETISTFVPSEETRSIVFQKDSDGNYAMQGDYMIGAVYNGLWQGYGDMYVEMTPFSADVVTAPSDIVYDYSYVLADELNGWDHTLLRPIGIGEADGMVYICGLSNSMPNAVFKGSFDKNANILTIPGNQFMGEAFGKYIFFMTGTGFTYFDPVWEEEMFTFDISTDDLVFDFDPLTMTLSPRIPDGADYVYFIFNFGNMETYPFEYYAVDRIYSQGEITDFTPIAPEVLFVSDIEWIDPEYSYSFEFNIFADNAEGQMLMDGNIFYNVYVNDQLVTFTSAQYPSLAEEGIESMTDIPVFLNAGSDFFCSGNYHGVALKIHDVETLGVRTVYIDQDMRYESPVVTVDTEGKPIAGESVGEIGSNAVTPKFFNLQGLPISRPVKDQPVIIIQGDEVRKVILR